MKALVIGYNDVGQRTYINVRSGESLHKIKNDVLEELIWAHTRTVEVYSLDESELYRIGLVEQ